MTFLELMATLKLNKDDYEKGLSEAKEDANTSGSSIAGAFGKVAKAGFKAFTVAVTTAATGIGALTKASIDAYAEYQQLEGGVKKLYGNMGLSLEEYAESVGQSTEEVKDKYADLEKAQNMVLENAKNAYKTSGMSMNQYMDTATSFSASLINSLGGDTVKAAEQTDVAMRAISDNFNTFGGDIGMIQGAFQGFAKQNYTMLDNLKLGYGGTKEEMERLIEDANTYAESIGQASDLSIESFSDIVTAIDLIQQKQQIAGTTEREAASTISGALNMTKASWENLLTAMSNSEDDLSGYITDLVDSVTIVAKNIMPVVKQAFAGVGQLITELAPVIADAIPMILTDALPSLLKAGVDLVQAILDGIQQNLPAIMQGAIEMITMLVDSFVGMLPQILEIGLQIIVQLAEGISKALPKLIPTIVDVALQIVRVLIDNLPLLVNASFMLITALAQGILENIDVIIDAIPTLVQSLVDIFVNMLPQMTEAWVKLMDCLEIALPEIVDAILEALPKLMDTIVNYWLGDGFKQTFRASVIMFGALTKAFLQIGASLISSIGMFVRNIGSQIAAEASPMMQSATTMFTGLLNGAKNILNNVINAVKTTISNAVSAVKNAVSQMYNVGVNLITGLYNGIRDKMAWVLSLAGNLATNLINKVKNTFKESSPSKVFYEIGDYLGVGLGMGWEDSMEDVNKQIDKDLHYKGTIDVTANAVVANTGVTGAVGSQNSNLTENDINRLLSNLQINLYNTTEIDGQAIKKDSYKYTVTRLGDETRAVKVAMGGF